MKKKSKTKTSQKKGEGGGNRSGINFGNGMNMNSKKTGLPNVEWRSIPFDHLRAHPCYSPLPQPHSVRSNFIFLYVFLAANG